MVKRHSSFVNRIKILEYVIENSKPVEWRGKIIGYGLRGTDFEKTKQDDKELPSRDVFNDYVDELWMDKHISRLKHSDKRQRHYTITPLGICYLIWSNGKLPTSISKILRILLSFYDHRKIKSKLLPKIGLEDNISNALKNRDLDYNDIFSQAIKNNIISSRMHYENQSEGIRQENIVTISLNVSYNLKLKLAELEITQFTQVILDENNYNIEKSFRYYLSLIEFYSYLSLFMLVLFFYRIHNVENYTEFLLDLIQWETKFKNNLMFKIINSLLKHAKEQMKLIGNDLDSIKKLSKY